MSTRLAKLMLMAVGAVALAAPPAAPLAADPRSDAARFVQAYATVNPFDYVVRWRSRLCVTVKGLPPDQAAKVQKRIEAVAQSLTLNLYSARQSCGGFKNVIIEFTPDAQRRLDEIIATDPRPLGDVLSDTRSVKTVTRPIQAWYQSRPCDSICGPERVYKHFYQVMVLVDGRRTAGADLTTIADYAAMLALSEPRAPDRCQALPSVLDLYNGPCEGRPAPAGLTPNDLAYLKAVYTAEYPVWQPVWNAGAAGDPPRPNEVAARMGVLLAGSAPLPAPGPAPLLTVPAR